jgi:hypothetical protein
MLRRGGGSVVPLATDAPQQTAQLLDHLVGSGEHRLRHRQAESVSDL